MPVIKKGSRMNMLRDVSVFIGAGVSLASLCVFSVFAGEETGQAGLTLMEAAKLAFRNNKTIQIQQKEVDAAKADILGAQSEFLPKINVTTGYTHNDWVPQFQSGPGVEPKKDIGLFTGYKNDLQAGASLTENLYNGGASIAQLNRSRLMFKVQEETLRARKLEVEFETRRLYYGLLLAYEVERISRELVAQAQAHFEDVQNKYNQGTSSKFDLLQSKVYVSKQIPGWVKAKNDIELIKADLRKLLGMKMDDAIRLHGKLEYAPVELREDEFLKTAHQRKPEMVLKLLGVDLGWWNIEMAKTGFRPQLAAGMGVLTRSNDPGDMFNQKHYNWNVGVDVVIPIFDGFSTKAKVDAAKAKYQEAVLSKEDVADQTAVDIRRACLDLTRALAIIDSQKDNVVEAKEALRIAIVSYNNGVGTNLDVLDAQTSLGQIEKTLSEAIYDYLMAQAFLDRTMGVSFIEKIETGTGSAAVNTVAAGDLPAKE